MKHYIIVNKNVSAGIDKIFSTRAEARSFITNNLNKKNWKIEEGFTI